MEFNTLYQELQDSTEAIRALLSGITQEEAQTPAATCGAAPCPDREYYETLFH